MKKHLLIVEKTPFDSEKTPFDSEKTPFDSRKNTKLTRVFFNDIINKKVKKEM